MSDKHMGKLTYIRIYSGSLESWLIHLECYNKKTKSWKTTKNAFKSTSEAIDKAYAGDIVAVVGLTETKTGDTLCTQEKPIIPEVWIFRSCYQYLNQTRIKC